MQGSRHSHAAFHAARRALQRKALEVSNAVGQADGSLNVPALVERQSTSQSSCQPGDNSQYCQLPTSSTNSTTLPIVLGVLIPLGAALFVFVYLHRRHVKKQRIEDANDKHASLDFGLGEHRGPRRKNQIGAPQMGSIPDPEGLLRRGRGMSMDMDSPYVPDEELPGRPSFNSMSRSAHDGDDPYSRSTIVMNDNNGPYPRSESRIDSASVMTRSSRSNSTATKANLIRNAQSHSSSTPPTNATNRTSTSTAPPDFVALPEPVHIVQRKPMVPPKDEAIPLSPLGQFHDTYEESPREEVEQQRSSVQEENQHKGQNFSIPRNIDRSSLHAQSPDAPFDGRHSPAPALPARYSNPPQLPTFAIEEPRFSQHGSAYPPAEASYPQDPASYHEDASYYPQEPAFSATVHSPQEANAYEEYTPYTDVLGIVQKDTDLDVPPLDAYMYEQGQYDSNHLGFSDTYDSRRLSGLRPLPPDDINDNPEQRANRIRSFYREYFDESRPDPVGRYEYDEYYEDYSQEYLNEAAVYDPLTGEFVFANAPYAEPVHRRAMTPPPRAPPRFHGGGHRSAGSAGHFIPGPRGQRAYSTSSGRPMGARGRAPRKHAPAPALLSTLPTPYKLRDDSAIFTAADFAPPATYKDRQMGSRPQSPLGEKRAYSPSVRAHTPLYSSFDELPSMPSPHALRKSATFTALDFAPPPRFMRSDAGSDSGSVRSNGSAMSATHLRNIRNGAYRVSRMQKDFVGTKADLAQALRPTWDQRQ